MADAFVDFGFRSPKELREDGIKLTKETSAELTEKEQEDLLSEKALAILRDRSEKTDQNTMENKSFRRAVRGLGNLIHNFSVR